MDDYNLVPGEFIILQEEDVSLGTTANNDDLTELVLTNKNLILVNDVPCGLFRRERMIKRCPLSQLQCHEGEALAPVVKQDDTFSVQAVFADETISLLFEYGGRRAAEHWSHAIKSAAAGDLNSIGSGDTLPPELSNLIEGAKDIFGAFGSKNQRPGAGAKKSMPVTVSGRCMGCHAPLTGNTGSVVACPYCDTKQTL